MKDDKTTGVAPREPHLEFQQDPECDEMHFLIPLSIHQTRMEPGTVLGTGNRRLTLALNFPSLTVDEAEL